jgi:3-(3-hydroxy-phenyl)propionate hydroxylase
MSGGSTALPTAIEVLVVGAGPVGLTMANMLGQAGIKTLLIDQHASLSGMPRAVALDDEGMRALQSVDLIQQITPHMLLGYDHHFLGRHGQLLLKINPTAEEFGFPKRNRFHQPELERQLLAGLGRFANVEVSFGTKLTQLTVGAYGSEVEFERDGSRGRINAQYVVACDGASSTARQILGIAMQGESHPDPWIVIDTENNPDEARFSRAVGTPSRPNVNVPGPSGTRRYEFMLLPHEREGDVLSHDMLNRLLTPWCDTSKVRIARHAVYTFHSLVADRFCEQRRVFLAGDAAHMMPPFQGQGMNSGLRDAANLSWKISAVLRGELGAAILDSYEQERKPHVLDMVALSRRVGAILMTRSPLVSWLRDMLFQICARLPMTRPYLTQMRFKPRPKAAKGYFVPAGCLAGQMFPQPSVLTRDGIRRPLDEVLGKGFALLQFDSHNGAPFTHFSHSFWSRLGARRIYVVQGGLGQVPEGADELIADIGGSMARAIGHGRPITLLLRPDRYVAAVIEPGAEDAIARQLDAIAPAGAAIE